VAHDDHPREHVQPTPFAEGMGTHTFQRAVIRQPRSRSAHVRGRRHSIETEVQLEKLAHPLALDGEPFADFVQGQSLDGAQTEHLAVTEAHEPVRVISVDPWARRMRHGLSRLPLIQTDPYAIRQSSFKQVSVGRLRLNHYAVRSRQEFEQKTARHGSSRLAPRYFAYHDRNEVHDPTLVPYAGKVRAQLKAIEART